MNQSSNSKVEIKIESKNDVSGKTQRLNSIDSLRGFDMFWITGGTELVSSFFLWLIPAFGLILETQFEHVAWNGFHSQDLIFPLFVFISGVSIPFAILKRKERGDPPKTIMIHILIRMITLFPYDPPGANTSLTISSHKE